jgi:DNA-directed RNA polymerase sigma subunit (sigma70/sigma32)
MTHKSVLAKVSSLELPSKAPYPYEGWGGISWEFEADTPSDPKSLDATTQRLVAESSATRFALLYEILHEDNTLSSIEERKIQRELDAILNLHTRIFSKYIGVRSRKYSYQGSATWIIQGELEQAGRTAIFECLRRWHPNRNIRFSRGAIGIAINREMIALVEQQRLVELPDKIRSVARKLKRAQEHGNLDSEVKRLTEEAGANCVKEASKHQNTYAFLSTVPIMDAYDETAAEQGAIPSGILHCMEDFSCHTPSSECTDVRELILNSAAKLTPEEKRALLAYHGIAEDGAHVAPKILEEIGAEEGVTKERIRQRIQKGKIKMRRYLEQKNIKSVHDAMMHR